MNSLGRSRSRGILVVLCAILCLAGLGVAWSSLGSESNPSFPRTSALELAKTAYAERRFARSEELARMAVEEARSNEAKVFLARVLLERGRWAEAAARFRDALKTVPEDIEAVRGLGLAALGQGREEEAVVHLTRVAQARRDDPVSWKELALAQRAAGDEGGATTSARTSLSLDREQADVQRLLTEMATASLRPRHEESTVRAPRPIDPRAIVPMPQVPDPTRHFPKPR